MGRSLTDLVGLWCDEVGLAPPLRPSSEQLVRDFTRHGETCRAGADPGRIRSWERRFGFPLPDSLKAWLRLSDGFYAGGGPLIHPLSAIGPMVPFAEIPGLAMQPESWFELGNPNRETVCIDLGYRWPGEDFPLFTSGDDERGTRPRIIAAGFRGWFLSVLKLGGREFWLDAKYHTLGEPWNEHRRLAPSPPISDRLQAYGARVKQLLEQGRDDGSIARELGLSRNEVELIVRRVQHNPGELTSVGVRGH